MFVREPIAGAVKTRLVPALGAGGAAALYRAFVEDVCARLAPRVPLALACAPEAGADGFVATLARRRGWPTFAQGDGDLGTRMRRVAKAALASASSVVLVGSDVPTLPVGHVTAALRALAPRRGGERRRRPRVVLGPSFDGGYYLLGLRAPLPDIFRRMPWSSERVLARTLARLSRARIVPALLPGWYDVDTPADLDLLARHLDVLATLGEEPCPRTRRVLARVRRRRGVRPRRSDGRRVAAKPAVP
jgi:rSAM/selenodomain-associated transferase 1